MNSSRQQQSARRKQAATKGIEIKTFSLPIPLRSDLILKIENLPLDLSEEEAERIAKIVKSYALQSLT